MNTNRVLSVCLTLFSSPALVSAADADRSPAKEAAGLVRQLSDESFEIRDAAHRRLTEMGKTAEAALRHGLSDDDAEVRRECQLLLERALRSELTIALDAFLEDQQNQHVLRLPAWSRFKKVAADDPSAKALFVEMCCNEAALLDALEKNPREASEKFAARCQQLQQAIFTPDGRRSAVTLGQVTALLFLATDGRLQLTPQAHYPLCTLFHQPLPSEGLQTNAVARRLLVAYLEQRSDPMFTHQNLYLVMNFNLKERLGWALKVAKNKSEQSFIRATALAAIGKVGGKEHVAALETFLTDTTQLGQSQFNTVRIQTEMRDVALAMIVQLSGQSAAEYGFPYLAQLQPALRANPQNVFFAPTLLGFADSASREAAFKRWKEWSEAEKRINHRGTEDTEKTEGKTLSRE